MSVVNKKVKWRKMLLLKTQRMCNFVLFGTFIKAPSSEDLTQDNKPFEETCSGFRIIPKQQHYS